MFVPSSVRQSTKTFSFFKDQSSIYLCRWCRTTLWGGDSGRVYVLCSYAFHGRYSPISGVCFLLESAPMGGWFRKSVCATFISIPWKVLPNPILGVLSPREYSPLSSPDAAGVRRPVFPHSRSTYPDAALL